MSKDKPEAEEIQFTFDLNDGDAEQAKAAKPSAEKPNSASKPTASPVEKSAGKLVKRRGGGNAEAREEARPPIQAVVAESAPAETEQAGTEQTEAQAPDRGNGIAAAHEPSIEVGEEAASVAELPTKPAPAPVPAGNGVDTAPAAAVTEAAPPAESEAMENGVRVVQLINSKDGCWKLLSDGERVALNDEEWRIELARQFKRESTVALPTTPTIEVPA